MNLRRVLSIGIGIILIIVTILVTRSLSSSKNNSTINFRLKWLAYNSFASHYVAETKGFYESENIAVEIRQGGPGIKPIQNVVSGLDSVGLASYDEIIVARSKGIPVIAIAEDFRRSGVGFFSLASNSIRNLNDFKGMKIAHRPGTDKDLLLRAVLNKEGIDIGELSLVSGASFPMLLSGSIDVFPGFLTNQPPNAEAKGFELISIDPYQLGIRPGGNVYFTTEKNLHENSEKLERFIRASIKARNYAFNASDEEVVDILMKINPNLNRNAELNGWKISKKILFDEPEQYNGAMALETWIKTEQLCREYGLIDQPVNPKDCFSNELISGP